MLFRTVLDPIHADTYSSPPKFSSFFDLLLPIISLILTSASTHPLDPLTPTRPLKWVIVLDTA